MIFYKVFLICILHSPVIFDICYWYSLCNIHLFWMGNDRCIWFTVIGRGKSAVSFLSW